MCRRFAAMLGGNALIAVGIVLFKASQFGVDPCTSLIMALADKTSMDFALCAWMVNIFFFAVQLLWGRKMIGWGTFVNWFLVGFLIDRLTFLLGSYVVMPTGILARSALLCIGVAVLGFAGFLYQAARLGVCPYDGVAIILTNHLKWEYFWVKISLDGICVILAFLLGAVQLHVLGAGTLVAVLAIGPIIHWFNRWIAKYIYVE